MGRSLNTLVTAGWFLLVCGPSGADAETFLFDDFTVTSNSQDVNQELGLRQSGSLAPVTYSANGSQHQVGNAETNVGQPGGASNSNYVLLASNSNFYSDLDIGSSLAQGSPLTIAFDMYVSGNPWGAGADYWGAFTLRAPSDGWPIANAGEFGMLLRNNGGIQFFQSAVQAPAAWDQAGFSTDPHWELTFSDTAGTGSAFDGNGSLLTFTNGSNTGSIALNQLSNSGLRLGFRNLDPLIIGIDNLSIEGTPRLVGDADRNGVVNIDDFYLISDNFYTTPSMIGFDGDTNFDGFVDERDFRAWRVAFGSDPANFVGSDGTTSVPEPATLASAMLLGFACLALRRWHVS